MSQNSKKNIRETGFTLVEILIALAILAMIVASTFTIFRSSSSSWQKGEARSERYHNARVALGRMSTEISQAVMSEEETSGFIGKKDEISFISFTSTAEGIFELTEVKYWLDPKERVLMRNEDSDPDYDFQTEDHSDILADNISELVFLYNDGADWKESWDSGVLVEKEDSTQEKVGLPKAVKIRIKVEDKRGKESETFEVVTRLKTA